MKKFHIIIASIAITLTAGSCAKLDVKPLSEASSANWYQNAEQITFSLNDLYRTYLYKIENEYWTDRRTDDWAQRDQVYDFCNGTVTSASTDAKGSTTVYSSVWTNTYKGISRAIRVIESIDKLGNPVELQSLKAEALFFRAYLYARLATFYGDAPFYTTSISVEEAYTMSRTAKEVIVKQAYADYDAAIEGLPVENSSSGVWRVTKGAALALKARLAITLGDYEECAKCCKEVMDSDTYSLYYSSTKPEDSYGELFRDKGFNTEVIFAIGRSIALADGETEAIKSWVLRTAGGTATAQPSWDLLAAYECTDGKLITESTLFDCHNPYENRDPRCCMTFVKPGTEILGVVFDPSPSALKTNKDGNNVDNKDNKIVDVYAPYNGCCIRKGAQQEWRDLQKNENPIVICRYADVLLMYAEAKMELNEIDGSVLNAINDIRARAYGVKRADIGNYPAITTTDQAELRKVIRRERRVELAWEGIRFWDLRRWGLLEKCYSHHYYGFPNQQNLKTFDGLGYWYWPVTPEIDEDGFADFTKMYDMELGKDKEGQPIHAIELYGFHKYDPKVELFPIPDKELLTNKNLTQNPGY